MVELSNNEDGVDMVLKMMNVMATLLRSWV